MYKKALGAMRQRMLTQIWMGEDIGDAWIAADNDGGQVKTLVLEHLTCFLPGTMALGTYSSGVLPCRECRFGLHVRCGTGFLLKYPSTCRLQPNTTGPAHISLGPTVAVNDKVLAADVKWPRWS
jgi:hypothetical protein